MTARFGSRPAGSLVILMGATFLTYACAAEQTADEMAKESMDAASDSAATMSETSAETPYSIDCVTDDAGKRNCVVDRDTFIGWRTFHGFCHVCHAQDAVGSTFAPSLLDRMQDIDFDLFFERTNNGYTGQVGVMPPWKDNPNVSKRYKELYAYLRARADGALARGRPKKKPK